jgi:hypothetical protein
MDMSEQLHHLATVPPHEEPPVSLNRSGGSQENYTNKSAQGIWLNTKNTSVIGLIYCLTTCLEEDKNKK